MGQSVKNQLPSDCKAMCAEGSGRYSKGVGWEVGAHRSVPRGETEKAKLGFHLCREDTTLRSKTGGRAVQLSESRIEERFERWRQPRGGIDFGFQLFCRCWETTNP